MTEQRGEGERVSVSVREQEGERESAMIVQDEPHVVAIVQLNHR